MPRIAIYTLTRERLEYTKYCFQLLALRAGVNYDHYVIDNGSQDGTKEWLKNIYAKTASEDNGRYFIFNEENAGISKASNQALDAIKQSGKKYDLIIKFDNDAEVISDNILGQVLEIYDFLKSRQYDSAHILSPYVGGINNQPYRINYTQLAGRKIGYSSIVGGIFHIVPYDIYMNYKYNEDLPKAKGQDEDFCFWLASKGCKLGYIEGLLINHYETTNGQAIKYPEYFKRKFNEEIKKCEED